MTYDAQPHRPTGERLRAATIRRVALYVVAILIVGATLACGLFSPEGESGEHGPPVVDTNPTTPAVPRGSAAVPGHP